MNPDDLRRLLREADPAAGHELDPVERAAMRRRLTDAAAELRRPRLFAAPLRVALATAAVAAFVLLATLALRRGPAAPAPAPMASRRTPPVENAGPMAEPQAFEAIGPQLEPSPRDSRQLRSHALLASARGKTIHAGPAAADGPATRIVFTGPDGTKILWFVGAPTLKEVGS